MVAHVTFLILFQGFLKNYLSVQMLGDFFNWVLFGNSGRVV